jgi:hypothetical protein
VSLWSKRRRKSVRSPRERACLCVCACVRVRLSAAVVTWKGGHILSGAVIETHALDELLPTWKDLGVRAPFFLSLCPSVSECARLK